MFDEYAQRKHVFLYTPTKNFNSLKCPFHIIINEYSMEMQPFGVHFNILYLLFSLKLPLSNLNLNKSNISVST